MEPHDTFRFNQATRGQLTMAQARRVVIQRRGARLFWHNTSHTISAFSGAAFELGPGEIADITGDLFIVNGREPVFYAPFGQLALVEGADEVCAHCCEPAIGQCDACDGSVCDEHSQSKSAEDVGIDFWGCASDVACKGARA